MTTFGPMQEIQTSVEADINNQKRLTQQEFYGKVTQYMQDTGSEQNKALEDVFNAAKNNGYVIDGYEDAFTDIPSTEVNIEEQEDTDGLIPIPDIGTGVDSIVELGRKKLEQFQADPGGVFLTEALGPKGPIRDYKAGMLAKIPVLANNIASIFIKDAGSKETEEFINQIQEKLAEEIGVNTKSLSFKGGGITTEFGVLASPAGVPGVVSKIPMLTKVPQLAQTALKGAEMGIRAEGLLEGEITPEGAITGAILTPVFQRIFGGKSLDATKKDIITKANQLVKGGSSKISTLKQADKAGEDLIKGAVELKSINPEVKTGNLQEVLGGARDTLDDLFVKNQKILQDNNINISGKDIKKAINKIKNTKNDELRNFLDVNPKVVGRLDELAESLSKDTNITGVHGKIKTLNSNLANFFDNKSTRNEAVVEAQVVKSLNDLMEKRLKTAGESFKGFRDSYSKIRKLESNLAKAYKKDIGKNAVGLVDFTDAVIVPELLTSLATGNLQQAAKAALWKSIRNRLSLENDPNFLIRKVFEGIDKTELGKRIPSQISEGATRIGVGETIKEF